jgi:hypothetical protein
MVEHFARRQVLRSDRFFELGKERVVTIGETDERRFPYRLTTKSF